VWENRSLVPYRFNLDTVVWAVDCIGSCSYLEILEGNRDTM